MADVNSSGESGVPAVTAASRYQVLELERAPVLQRARDCSAITIPGVLPPAGYTQATDLPTPFQSTGADGVNNLSAKLLMILFPPQRWFRLRADAFKVEQMAQDQRVDEGELKQQIESALSKVERAIMDKMESKGTRTVRHEALQHLIITGNALKQVMPDGREKFYALDKYVVARDLDDNVLEIVVEETLAREALPPEALAILQMKTGDQNKNSGNEKSVKLYTWIRRQTRPSGAWYWQVDQEIEGTFVPGTRSIYPKDKTAWLPLRWKRVSGAAYGRGLCEEYLGDLNSHESATESIVKFGAAVSKIVFGVDDAGTTDAQALQDADSGDVIAGNLTKDVSVLMVEKTQDFQVLQMVDSKVERRLEKAFMLASSVQRDAERVTAEEIRVMLGQVEESIGGSYALLSEEWQKPLVIRHLLQMQRAKELPFFPDNIVTPQIVTGLEGLGRQSDADKLDTFVEGMAELFGPVITSQTINPRVYATAKATALGIDIPGLVYTDQQAQQMQQNEVASKMAPQLVGAAQNAAQQQQQQQAQPTQEGAQ